MQCHAHNICHVMPLEVTYRTQLGFNFFLVKPALDAMLAARAKDHLSIRARNPNTHHGHSSTSPLVIQSSIQCSRGWEPRISNMNISKTEAHA